MSAPRSLTVGRLREFIKELDEEKGAEAADAMLVHIMDLDPETHASNDDERSNIATNIETDRFGEDEPWVVSIYRWWSQP